MADFILTTPTTTLEAVNTLLGSIGQAPVSSLNIEGHSQLGIAKGILNEVNREVQARGWWFNFEREYPLVPNGDNHIMLADNILSVDESTIQANRDVVQRGSRLYDRHNHTYEITETIKADVIFLLPFTELPEQARRYIAIRAARIFQMRQTRSRLLHVLSQEQESAAKADVMRADAEHADRNMKNSPAVWRVTPPWIRRPV